MKRFVVVLLFSSVLLADGSDETFGLRNGRFWTGTLRDDNLRHAFILGLVDTWEFRTSIQDPVPGSVLLALGSGGSFRTDELSAMVTSVYAEIENVELPVGWVVVACLAVKRGDTDRQSVFVALRKHLASIRSSSSPLGAQEIDPLRVIFNLKRSRPRP